MYNSEIKIGHYTGFDIVPTCGLASSKALTGEVDDSRYFEHPDRYDADILWFSKGHVEYVIPNFIPRFQKITKISITMELGSEAPGSNNRKGTFIDGLKISDISINDFELDYRSNIHLKSAVDNNAKQTGGLTLYGKTFGNYGQDINLTINYAPV